MKWVALFLPVILADCAATHEEQAARDQRISQRYQDRCAAMGAQTQEQFFQCRMQLQQADQARAAAYQRALNPVFDQMIYGKPQQQTHNQPTTCRTVREGQALRTTCF